ncbi:hypothetical protein TNCV_586451 [Trichonephila clavipes]|nr:hypothetical protein TNCV_586451 [Trichonephila clavipes]
MTETRVLLPLPKDDGRKNGLQTRATKLRKLLEEKNYETLGEFLVDNNLTMVHYLDTTRATLRRPTVVFKRDLSEIYTNTFNPWIARTVCANSDLQFILEEYSCAVYVVEYVNKSNRGNSNLHQELIKIQEQNPEKEYVEIMKQLGVKFLNTVEMSSQKAAWYLLRQPMSRSSREVSYIPTVWSQERHKLRKRKAVMDEENLDENSTDIWTKSMIQRYEERPSELEDKCLADFVAWYTPVTKKGRPLGTEVNDDASGDDEPAPDNVPYESTSTIGSAYRKRSAPRVIRYRGYELNDVVNYKREMSNIDIAKILDELKKICEDFDNVDPLDTSNSRDDFVRNVLGPDGTENNDDFENSVNTIGISAVRKRSSVMSKQEYCHMMRSTNNGQRELILETIHRLHLSDSIPIQIFFTGPAGSDKTYVLKLLMETYNRYTQQHNSLRNAFVACASTGKAAVNLGGVTVHSAFKITQSRRIGTMAREVLQNYRSTFIGVKCIIIDEVSMIGCDVLHKINLRLQEITGVHDQPFGNLNIIFCGDLHQLPPVNASTVYKGPRNSMCGPVLWQSLDYYPLEQVRRQSDSTFSEILTKIGNGERLGTEQIALIESRFRSRAWCKVNVPATVRLFHRNHDVDAYNNNAFIPEFENIADDKMIGYNKLTEIATARRNLHKMSVVESGGLPYSLKLAVGYPYMITMNLDVEDGLVNGAIGTLKYIEYLTEDEQVTIYGTTEVDVEPQPSTSTRIRKRVSLWLEFPNPSMGQLCRVKAKPIVYFWL